jgi:hypothetical protein
MGVSGSKQGQGPKKAVPTQALSFKEQIRSGIEEEISRRMMLQREINMALNIAKARDTIQIFGSLYGVFVGGVAITKIAGKPVPHIVGVPIVVGAVLLGNIADMAYGNKMGRVVKEAEYLLDNERARFVPFKQVREREKRLMCSCVVVRALNVFDFL